MVSFPCSRSLWVPFLWSTWADCQHAHGWEGAESSADNNVFCEWHEGGQVATESTLLGGRPCRGVLSGYFNSGRLPLLPTSHRSLEADLGLLYQQPGSRPCPWQGCDNHRAKRRRQPISREGLDHHNANYSPYAGDKGQQTPRKDVVGIHSKNRLRIKNTGYTGTLT